MDSGFPNNNYPSLIQDHQTQNKRVLFPVGISIISLAIFLNLLMPSFGIQNWELMGSTSVHDCIYMNYTFKHYHQLLLTSAQTQNVHFGGNSSFKYYIQTTPLQLSITLEGNSLPFINH